MRFIALSAIIVTQPQNLEARGFFAPFCPGVFCKHAEPAVTVTDPIIPNHESILLDTASGKSATIPIIEYTPEFGKSSASETLMAASDRETEAINADGTVSDTIVVSTNNPEVLPSDETAADITQPEITGAESNQVSTEQNLTEKTEESEPVATITSLRRNAGRIAALTGLSGAACWAIAAFYGDGTALALPECLLDSLLLQTFLHLSSEVFLPLRYSYDLAAKKQSGVTAIEGDQIQASSELTMASENKMSAESTLLLDQTKKNEVTDSKSVGQQTPAHEEVVASKRSLRGMAASITALTGLTVSVALAIAAQSYISETIKQQSPEAMKIVGEAVGNLRDSFVTAQNLAGGMAGRASEISSQVASQVGSYFTAAGNAMSHNIAEYNELLQKAIAGVLSSTADS